MDLPLRPGAAAQDLEFDPLGGDPGDGLTFDGAADLNEARRQEGHQQGSPRKPRPRRALLILVSLLFAAVVLWLVFPEPPRAELSLEQLEFGTLRVGGSSEEKTIVVTNRGERRLAVEALRFASDVAADYEILDQDCLGRKIVSQQSCEIRLAFRPRQPGDRSSLLVFESNDRSHPAVSVAAVAVAPELGLAPSAVSFGVVALESEAESREVTLSNVGSASLEFHRIRIEGTAASDYSRSRRCSSSRLGPGEACSFEIRFQPSVSGPRLASLVVDSDALGSPATLALEGVGLWRGAPLHSRLEVLDLGEQGVGKRGAPGRLEFVNRTGGPVSVDRTAVSGSSSFAVVEDGCRGRTVASGGTCSIAVTFLPVDEGADEGLLSLEAAGATETVEVALTGRGVIPRLEAEVGALDFQDQRVSFESAARIVRFRNTGTATLSPRSASISGGAGAEFVLRSNACVGKTLAAGASCSIGIGFNPARTGARQALLSLEPGAELEPLRVPLSGSGVASVLRVDPGGLEYRQVYLGRVEDRVLKLTNAGSARLDIGGLRFEGDDAEAFSLGQMSCALDSGLAPGTSCQLEIAFEPGQDRRYGARLVLEHNGPDSPARVELAGEGTTPAPAFRISTDSLDLGSVPIGGRGEIGTLVISNPGAAWLPLTKVILQGADAGDFQLVAGSCDGVTALAPGGSCTLGVRLLPISAGARRAAILVRHGAGSGSALVTLTGQGLPPSG